MLTFVASRVGALQTGFSRGDALQALRERDARENTIEMLDRVLRALERARYGGVPLDTTEVRRVIDALESEALSPAKLGASR